MEITSPDRAERDPQTSAIIGAAIEVHKQLGRGFLEYVYRRPLEMELAQRGVPFEREVAFPIVYKGRSTGVTFRVDLLCFDDIVVEIKALKEITGSEKAQVINYLHVARRRRGLLLNFGGAVLGIHRYVIDVHERPELAAADDGVRSDSAGQVEGAN